MALNINGTTGISGVDGSVSAPAVTGTDSNTGITFPSADTIKFATGGVERMSITNSGITGIVAGITIADQWRVTSSVSLSNADNYLTSNWERVDTTGQGTVGTAMSESGGIFTFPSTGIYKVEWQGYFSDSGSSEASAIDIYLTTNNSSYSQIAGGFTSVPDTGSLDFGYVTVQTFVDVTDVTQVKVKFRVYSNDSVTFVGSSTYNANCATFIRLGDT